MKLVLASNNPKKLKELGEILSPLLDKRTLVTTLNNAKG